ncbi:trypsin-like serine protease [Bdellovibrio bacteriovorus]|uniref:S1 family peptidase n=1 Tax=Bdellovibrio bacteriovorus TaxID=959 RepID=UPI0021D1046D|nr:trypsin-like serine protease [Bdellovibrio bacteriovorus]UXR63266.1 trypsin-like serine protease [Bdellovibrio bacteriovorus]
MFKKFSLTLAAVALLAACAQQNTAEILDSESSTGVIGGDKVQLGSAVMTSTVGLYDEMTGSLCTGTLISKELVLTAAHCVTPGSTGLMVFFTNNLENMNAYNSQYAIKALQHEDYDRNRKTDTADIALVRIRGNYLPAGYQPAKIHENTASMQSGNEVVVAGYGLSWALGVKKGAGILRTTKLKIDQAQYGKTEFMLKQSLKKGVCSGDSGGPAYVEKDGQLYLAGVASRGDAAVMLISPKCDKFSIYSRADAYMPWIKKTSETLMSLR